MSQLLIQSAMVTDTGVYTCHLHYSHRPDTNHKLRDNITVHVLQGKNYILIQRLVMKINYFNPNPLNVMHWCTARPQQQRLVTEKTVNPISAWRMDVA